MGPIPMMGARLPDNAEIVHDGPFLRLGRVREMPANNGGPGFAPQGPPEAPPRPAPAAEGKQSGA